MAVVHMHVRLCCLHSAVDSVLRQHAATLLSACSASCADWFSANVCAGCYLEPYSFALQGLVWVPAADRVHEPPELHAFMVGQGRNWLLARPRCTSWSPHRTDPCVMLKMLVCCRARCRCRLRTYSSGTRSCTPSWPRSWRRLRPRCKADRQEAAGLLLTARTAAVTAARVAAAAIRGCRSCTRACCRC